MENTLIPAMPAEEYHSDPCPEPSLSSSIAKVLWQKSPKHAWVNHPRLNPEFEPTNRYIYDLGSAAHALLLEKSRVKITTLDFDNYRTKASKEARDSAYENHQIPILEKDLPDVEEMGNIARDYIGETELAGIFEDGKPEQTLIAHHKGIYIRTRLDWLTNERDIILDYKTTGGSSRPEDWIRTMLFQMGNDIRAATYLLANELTGGPEDAKFVWLVQENKPPYACSLVGAGPSTIATGKKKLGTCIHKWQWCLEHDIWPVYEARIAWADAPAWAMQDIEERGQDV